MLVALAITVAIVVGLLLAAPGDDVHAALAAEIGGKSREPATIDSALADVAICDAGPAVVDLRSLLLRREPAALPRLVDARIEGWVNDLRDDGIPGNALRAMPELITLPAGDIPELTVALAAHDQQLRHFAAGVLRARCDEERTVVTRELLQVSIAALRSDPEMARLESAAFATWVGPLGLRSARFLQKHAVAARDLLADPA